MRVLKTSDPDEYARWCNRLILMERGEETDGPGEIGKPSFLECKSCGLRIEYVPPTADQLAEAVTKEAT